MAIQVDGIDISSRHFFSIPLKIMYSPRVYVKIDFNSGFDIKSMTGIEYIVLQ